MSERWSGIFKRSKVKIIVLPVIAVICAVLLVAGNIVLSMFNPILHRVFSGDGISVSGSASVLSEADKVVRKTAEESMVLLYNEDGYLPQRNLKKVNLFGWGATDGGFLLTGDGSGGATSAAYDNHMYCYLKHFAVSEAGFNPKYLNTWLTEQGSGKAICVPLKLPLNTARQTP